MLSDGFPDRIWTLRGYKNIFPTGLGFGEKGFANGVGLGIMFSNGIGIVRRFFQVGNRVWNAISIGHFPVGTKTSGSPTGTTAGMKFLKHGYPSWDLPNVQWVFLNKSRSKELTETVCLVCKATTVYKQQKKGRFTKG